MKVHHSLREDNHPALESSNMHSPVVSIDAFNNGIAVAFSRDESISQLRETSTLPFGNDDESLTLKTKYSLHRDSLKEELTKHLKKLHESGTLQESVVLLGARTDPFHPFEGRFETSMQTLEVLKTFTPGRLIIQTRSPLLVIALPALKAMTSLCTVRVPLETHLDEMVRRYTPTLPKASERLKLMRALRNFGVDVEVHLGPLLPYGDWKADAHSFVKEVAPHANAITVSPLLTADIKAAERSKLETSILGQKLARDRNFYWLRKDAAHPIEQYLTDNHPELCQAPDWSLKLKRQIDMFAA